MRIYISGPITGVKDYMEKFRRAEDYLKSAHPAAGILNPARVNNELPDDFSYAEYMEISIKELSMCDAVYMLEGWRKSLGACMEYGYALGTDKIIIEEGKNDLQDRTGII